MVCATCNRTGRPGKCRYCGGKMIAPKIISCEACGRDFAMRRVVRSMGPGWDWICTWCDYDNVRGAEFGRHALNIASKKSAERRAEGYRRWRNAQAGKRSEYDAQG